MSQRINQRAIDLFLTEASKGCLMAVLSVADCVPIVEWTHEHIPADALAGDGYENSSHVTIAYGFAESATPAKVQKAVSSWGRARLAFTLGEVHRFEHSDEYDVLVVKLSYGDECVSLNAHLADAFGKKLEQTFDYTPHLTLAYVAKGTCRTLDGHAQFKDNTYVLQSLVYSLPESVSKHTITLSSAD